MSKPRPFLGPEPVDGPYCRNCGAVADIHYCPVCGQETAIEMPTVGHFLSELAEQTLALQGQLWTTLISLLFRPGQLTVDYIAGRRQRYVRPLRLYLALSIVFFAILGFTASLSPEHFFPRGERAEAAQASAAEPSGAAAAEPVAEAPPDVPASPEAPAKPSDPAAGSAAANADKGGLTVNTGYPALDARIQARFETLKALPEAELSATIADALFSYAPIAIFFTLPLFALLIGIGYLGLRLNYAVHLLFAINYHSFLFFLLLVELLPIPSPASTLLALTIPAYLTIALRRVYGGGWGGTAFFSFLMLIVHMIVVALVMSVSTLLTLAFPL